MGGPSRLGYSYPTVAVNDIDLALASLSLIVFRRSIAFGSSTILNAGSAGLFAGFADFAGAFAAGAAAVAGAAGAADCALTVTANTDPTTSDSARPIQPN